MRRLILSTEQMPVIPEFCHSPFPYPKVNISPRTSLLEQPLCECGSPPNVSGLSSKEWSLILIIKTETDCSIIWLKVMLCQIYVTLCSPWHPVHSKCFCFLLLLRMHCKRVMICSSHIYIYTWNYAMSLKISQTVAPCTRAVCKANGLDGDARQAGNRPADSRTSAWVKRTDRWLSTLLANYWQTNHQVLL